MRKPGDEGATAAEEQQHKVGEDTPPTPPTTPPSRTSSEQLSASNDSDEEKHKAVDAIFHASGEEEITDASKRVDDAYKRSEASSSTFNQVGALGIKPEDLEKALAGLSAINSPPTQEGGEEMADESSSGEYCDSDPFSSSEEEPHVAEKRLPGNKSLAGSTSGTNTPSASDAESENPPAEGKAYKELSSADTHSDSSSEEKEGDEVKQPALASVAEYKGEHAGVIQHTLQKCGRVMKALIIPPARKMLQRLAFISGAVAVALTILAAFGIYNKKGSPEYVRGYTLWLWEKTNSFLSSNIVIPFFRNMGNAFLETLKTPPLTATCATLLHSIAAMLYFTCQTIFEYQKEEKKDEFNLGTMLWDVAKDIGKSFYVGCLSAFSGLFATHLFAYHWACYSLGAAAGVVFGVDGIDAAEANLALPIEKEQGTVHQDRLMVEYRKINKNFP